MRSGEEVGEAVCLRSPGRDQAQGGGYLLFNEVTRPEVEKWPLDCARTNEETLSHLLEAEDRG